MPLSPHAHLSVSWWDQAREMLATNRAELYVELGFGKVFHERLYLAGPRVFQGCLGLPRTEWALLRVKAKDFSLVLQELEEQCAAQHYLQLVPVPWPDLEGNATQLASHRVIPSIGCRRQRLRELGDVADRATLLGDVADRAALHVAAVAFSEEARDLLTPAKRPGR